MAKKRAVFLLLVMLSAWPILHHVMVTTWDTDPWRFFGLSMYCAPRSQVRVVSVEGKRNGVVTAQFAELQAAQTRTFNRLVSDLRRGRTTFGRLHDWRSTFREMFALMPADVESLTVTLNKSYLDPDAMLRKRLIHLECRRPKGEQLDCSLDE